MAKIMYPSAKDVEDAVEPVIGEIFNLFRSVGQTEPLMKTLLEKLYVKGYKHGYNTKTIQTELDEYNRKHKRKPGRGSSPDSESGH